MKLRTLGIKENSYQVMLELQEAQLCPQVGPCCLVDSGIPDTKEGSTGVQWESRCVYSFRTSGLLCHLAVSGDPLKPKL